MIASLWFPLSSSSVVVSSAAAAGDNFLELLLLSPNCCPLLLKRATQLHRGALSFRNTGPSRPSCQLRVTVETACQLSSSAVAQTVIDKSPKGQRYDWLVG